MTIHHLPQLQHTALTQLVQGESAMANAPCVSLANGYRFIPQHYLRYQHTAERLTMPITYCYLQQKILRVCIFKSA